jgi:VanZ family protein
MYELLMNRKGTIDYARNAEIFIVIVFELIFIALYIQSLLINDFTRSLWPLFAIILTLVPFVFEWKDKVSLPYGLKMVIPFALFLHVAGGIMRWYWEVPLFDKLAHVVSAIALGLILFTMYQYLDYLEYVKKKPFFKRRIRIFRTQEQDVLAGIFVILVIFGLAWECSERIIDLVYLTTYNFGLVDSVTDFAGDLIGVLIVIYLVHRTMETIPPGEHLDYLLVEHGMDNRSEKPDLLPIGEKPEFL